MSTLKNSVRAVTEMYFIPWKKFNGEVLTTLCCLGQTLKKISLHQSYSFMPDNRRQQWAVGGNSSLPTVMFLLINCPDVLAKLNITTINIILGLSANVCVIWLAGVGDKAAKNLFS